MKICVLNYTGDRANWGCQATSRNLLGFLRSSLEGVPDLEIVTVPLPKTHPVDGLVAAAHGASIRAMYASPSPSANDLRFLHALTSERFGDILREAETADIVVFQGEGTVGPQAYLRNVQLFGPPFLAAHLWQKPVLAVNQTLYACSAADAEVVAGIFGAFALVAVREARSYAFARGIGLDELLLCPDMAFAATPAFPGPPAPVPPVPYFCISGSAVLTAHSIGSTLAAVREIAGRHGLRPVFVFSRPADGGIVRAAERSLGGIPCDVVSSDEFGHFEQILPLLAAATLVLGGRYHTSISALSEGTPVVLLPGNTFKTEGLGPMLGLEFPVISSDDVPGIVSEASRLIDAGEELRQRIRAAVRQIRSCQARFGDIIRQFVTDGVVTGTPQCLTPAPSRFPEPGPHDDLYVAKNRAPRSPLAMLGRWQLRCLRQATDFRPSLRASMARSEKARGP
ncbi:MAG: polysaccharide pyruvyl transferase family protein [Planctomycetia bacterium]|nr:polysaccharide pyruvyl transferase family protein [Planctomycetia bacterium]